MKLVLKMAIAALLWYACVAYVLLQPNLFLWSLDQRFDFVFWLCAIELLIYLFSKLDYETR